MTTMTTKPRVIIHKADSRKPAQTDFVFEQNAIRLVSDNGYIRNLRSIALQKFQSLPIPSVKDGDSWRRTDLNHFQPDKFRMVDPENCQGLPEIPEDLRKPVVAAAHAGQISLSPGCVDTWMLPELSSQGVVFTDLLTAEREHPQLLEKVLGKLVTPDDGKFASLVEAFAQTGALLYVPSGVHIGLPLHVLLWSVGENVVNPAHIAVVLEEGAAATFVLETISPPDGNDETMNALVLEILVGENAHLNFVELQSLGNKVWNFSHERVKVAKDGSVDWVFGAAGSRLTKSFLNLELTGQGSSGKMSGLYFADGVQHLDHDTRQNHLAPNPTSDLLFKGARLGESRSVWRGMIYVAPDAAGTDGYQSNRNLVLDRRARADSIPGLEINTDDVRCTHGATVGQLDDDQIFYLQSRGIPRKEAEQLVVKGFFEPVLQRIPFEGVRQRFEQLIAKKMNYLNE